MLSGNLAQPKPFWLRRAQGKRYRKRVGITRVTRDKSRSSIG
jgi:hypothetical protein